MVSATYEEHRGLNSPAKSHADYSRIQQCGDRILLVEDDMPTLRLERVILEESGYLVEGVESGEAALELIAEETPALIILDIGLPGIDGFTTCRRIRESSQVPVVMVTGNKTAADKKQGTAAGANGYVTKPFLTDKLVDLVGEIISESAGDSSGTGEWEREVSQPFHTPPPDPQPANAAEPSTPVLDVGKPIGESEFSPAEEGAKPDGYQTDGDQAMESALSWHSDDSPDTIDDEEPEDDPTDVAVVWNSQEQQSPQEDTDSEDSLLSYGGEPEYPIQGVNQPASASAVAFDQGQSSAAFSLEEQPAEDLVETAHDDQAPDDDLTDKLDDDLYEGTVRLVVTSTGPVKNLLNFVGELRQNGQLRLLRLVASQRSESMDIWLGLREPLQLIAILGDIPGVSQVADFPDPDGEEEERRLAVSVSESHYVEQEL